MGQPFGVLNRPAPTDRHLLQALALLTMATGLIDAASVLGLGHVFTANMTGNIAFLGFALAHTGGASLSGCLVALASFSVGAGLGGALAARGRSFALALAVEVGFLCVAWASIGETAAPPLVPVALLALAMGVHNASVRKLGIADMTTTVLTMAITGLAADSSLVGGDNPRFGRRLSSVGLLLAGALLGALLVRRGVGWPIGLATLVVAVAAKLALRATSARALAVVSRP